MSCEKTEQDVYEFLCKFEDEPSQQWLGRKCVETRAGLLSEIISMKEHQRQIEEKVNDLACCRNKKLDELIKQLNTINACNQQS